MNRREAFKNTALLFGVAISGSAITSVFNACDPKNRLSWKPVFFSEKQAATVSAIAESILPKTDTPGARELKVDVFIDVMVKETLSPEEQERIKTGIGEFSQTSKEMFGKAFEELPEEEQHQVLDQFEKEANTFNASVWGSTIGVQEPIHFYRRIKQLTLLGYYTSEYIGKNVLVYDPVPGVQLGCIPLKDVGNSWSL